MKDHSKYILECEIKFIVFCQKRVAIPLYLPFLSSLITFSISLLFVFSLSSKLSVLIAAPFSTFYEEHQHFRFLYSFISSLLFGVL